MELTQEELDAIVADSVRIATDPTKDEFDRIVADAVRAAMDANETLARRPADFQPSDFQNKPPALGYVHDDAFFVEDAARRPMLTRTQSMELSGGQDIPEAEGRIPPVGFGGGGASSVDTTHPFKISVSSSLIYVEWGAVSGQSWFEDTYVWPAAVELVPSIGGGGLLNNPLGAAAGSLPLVTCGIWCRIQWFSVGSSLVPWFGDGYGDNESFGSYPGAAVVVPDATLTDYDDGQELAENAGGYYTYYYIGKVTVSGATASISQWRRSDLLLRGLIGSAAVGV